MKKESNPRQPDIKQKLEVEVSNREQIPIDDDLSSDDPYLKIYKIRRLEVIREVFRFKLIYAIAGIILGSICMIGGIILFLHGVLGSTTWTAEFLGAKSEIVDAAPGAILFIVGLFLIWVTKLKMNIRTSSGSVYGG